MSLFNDKNCAVEYEKLREDYLSEFQKHYEKSWEEVNKQHFLMLLKKKEDYDNYIKLESQIQDLKQRADIIKKSSCDIENQITELSCQISMIETDIQKKSIVKDKLVEQCKILEMKTNKLKQVHHMLQERRKLYDDYFSCSLTYEPPDIYNFSFLKQNVKVGQIKFQYNELHSRWYVLGAQPKDILRDDILHKFHLTQDTQGLLCYFRKLLY